MHQLWRTLYHLRKCRTGDATHHQTRRYPRTLQRRQTPFRIHRALEKRPVSVEDVEAAIVRIKQKLRATGEREVPSRILGECVMAELRQLDQVAYVRFASVYRSFQDLDEFRAEIERISSPLSPLADSKEEEA